MKFNLSVSIANPINNFLSKSMFITKDVSNISSTTFS